MAGFLKPVPEEVNPIKRKQIMERRIIIASITISAFIILCFAVLCSIVLIFEPKEVVETLEHHDMPNLAELMKQVADVMGRS